MTSKLFNPAVRVASVPAPKDPYEAILDEDLEWNHKLFLLGLARIDDKKKLEAEIIHDVTTSYPLAMMWVCYRGRKSLEFGEEADSRINVLFNSKHPDTVSSRFCKTCNYEILKEKEYVQIDSLYRLAHALNAADLLETMGFVRIRVSNWGHYRTLYRERRGGDPTYGYPGT